MCNILSLPGNRYKLIPERLAEAIHGLRHFQEEHQPCPPEPLQASLWHRRHFYLRLSTGIIDPYRCNRPYQEL
jgi:hypothetical protein